MDVIQIIDVTVFKTQCNMIFSKKSQKGFTFVELMVVIAILMAVFTIISVLVHPLDQMKKARDNQRLSDVNILDRAVSEFLLDNQRYPDQENILRCSNILPSGSSDLDSSNPGWIYENLSSFTEKLPIDPLNTDIFHYCYFHNSNGYEISAKLEYYVEKMSEDGGDSLDFLEVGNNLNLITH